MSTLKKYRETIERQTREIDDLQHTITVLTQQYDTLQWNFDRLVRFKGGQLLRMLIRGYPALVNPPFEINEDGYIDYH